MNMILYSIKSEWNSGLVSEVMENIPIHYIHNIVVFVSPAAWGYGCIAMSAFILATRRWFISVPAAAALLCINP
jgi:hypothetical protein